MTASITLQYATGGQATLLDFTGSGFLPLTTVTAKFNGVAAALQNATTDATGALTGASIAVPRIAAGTYVIAVTDAVNTADANYTVVVPATTTKVQGWDAVLNKLAGTTQLGAVAAANAWAGSKGLGLVAAINYKNGWRSSGNKPFQGLVGACNTAAGTVGLDALGALNHLAWGGYT